MTASNSLTLFRSPVVRDRFSSDSAFPAPSHRRPIRPTSAPQPSPSPLTRTLPNTEGALMLGLAVLALPTVAYSLLQLSSLLSNGLLTRAIQAFAY